MSRRIVISTISALLAVAPVGAPASAAASSDIILTAAGAGGQGAYGGDGGPATQARLYEPNAVAADRFGNLYIADSANLRIRKVNTTGVIATVGGNGESGFGGEGGPIGQAQFSRPDHLVFDSVGDLLIADTYNGRIRKVAAGTDGVIDPADTITTVAGGGTADGDGPAAQARLLGPTGLAVSAVGDLYIAEAWRSRIRKVTAGADGVIDRADTITTVAGGGTAGYSGDGGPAAAAALYNPHGVIAHGDGDLYIADSSNNRIRKVTAGADGVVDPADTITTVAGSGRAGYSGDGGPATLAELRLPVGMVIDGAGDLLFSDSDNHVVRKVDISGSATITTVAGRGVRPGFSGDGGPAIEAQLFGPRHLHIDPAGAWYIAEQSNNRVRRVGPDLLALSAEDDHDPVAVGASLAYTFTLKNHSSDTATAVTFTDILPPGVSNPSARPSQGTCSQGGGKVSCALGDVAPGGTATVNIAVTAPSAEAVLANQASVQAAQVDAFPNNNFATETTTVTPPSDISVATTDAPDPVGPGQPITYTVRVANDGPTQAPGVTLVDTLPPEVGFVAASASQGGCSRSPTGVIDGVNLARPTSPRPSLSKGGTLTCNLGDLPPNSQVTVETTVTAPDESAVLSNKASVSSGHGDPNWTDNTHTAHTVVSSSPPVEGLGLASVDSPDPAIVGRPLTYTLTVTNGLSRDATGVTLTDTLPAEVSFSSVTPIEACSEAGGTVRCELGTLAPEASVTVRIAVTPKAPGDITNSATVRSLQSLIGNTATAKTRVSAASCGQVITDDTSLQGDVGPCAANGIIVGTDGITLDLNGYHVFGFPGPSGLDANGVLGNQGGIRLPGRTGVIVKNGTVRDFDAGVVLVGGSSNTVRDLTARDNIGPDDVFNSFLGDGIVLFDSTRNTIANNTVLHNGVFDGIGLIGGDSDHNTIQGNLVEDNIGPSDLGPAGQGIIMLANDGDGDGKAIDNTTIVGNQVRRNAASGISNVGHVNGTIDGNRVEGNGLPQLNAGTRHGIGIQRDPSWRADSLTHTGMLVRNNEVHGNAQDGIHVESGSGGNQILDNDARDNNLGQTTYYAARGYDLHDMDALCADNVWSRNQWGTGLFEPRCTWPPETAISSGPPAVTSDNTPTFEFSSSEPTSSFECRMDDARWEVYESPCPTPYTHMPALADGPHALQVRAVDPASPRRYDRTPERYQFIVDSTPPETTIDSGPSGPTADETPTFTFSANEEGATFTCRIDGADFAPCTSPFTAPALALGPHSFEVVATDAVGNADTTPATRSFIVELPAMSVADASINEGHTATRTLLFTVSLSLSPNREVTVAFATANGTAAAPGDYIATSGTMSFAPGETTKTIGVVIMGDRRREPNETFFVNLSGSAGATVSDGRAVGTITNDDGKG